MELYTIGHSDHSLEDFIKLLKQHHITAVADVRSHPYSRYLSHFNKSELQASLEKENITYVFLGQELGARPNNENCYINGKAVYEKIANTALFQEGIQRVLKGVKKYRVALMCAEKDPLTCHRTILVCQQLNSYNLEIKHILPTGKLESHEDLENRLLDKQGFSQLQLSLFDIINTSSSSLDKEQCLQQAYQKQGEIIAYVQPKEEQSK
ncbi:DUF488 domain-containing protein [Aphanothece sacrum]|uniref:DNA repair protein n=1 Tax=Aphanothece sacrum FPU1 TaxID=1920663 RepID=A0A401IF05_APHSA|nr:DUF488 domain-containing protein [Aphanothece sacrum]GBF79872.1 DNA repair protein [Aphanothece sacrum FPU1]GBF83908.1 DNA repair protein [Aphanothece sacrum FPU3]